MKFVRSIEGPEYLILEDPDDVRLANIGYWAAMASRGTPMDPTKSSVMSEPLTRGGEYPKTAAPDVTYFCMRGMGEVLLKELEQHIRPPE